MSVRQPVRPLSIENLTEAYPLELVADFSTGNFTLVKQDGNTVEHRKPGRLSVKYGSTFLLNNGNLADELSINIPDNAGTATKFASAQSIALTGDVSGSASSQAGWSIDTTLANSGVTAGSYGPSANASPKHSETFSVPYITVDAKGRVTSASTKTITLPANADIYTHPSYTARSLGLYKITVDGTGHVSDVSVVEKSDITALGIPAQDTVYTHPAYIAKASGLYKITVDATGHVSATAAVAKSDITALGIPAQDTVYTHPSYTAKASGLYKITVDATGHVSATAAVAKSDITALGIPAQDTIYSADKGISLTGTTFGHSNSIAADTAQGSATKTLAFGGTFNIPTITYDAYGHITGKGITTMTMPAAPTTISGNAGSATKLANARTIGISGVTATSQSFDGTDNINIPITAIPASLLTGTIDIARIPQAALERLVHVDDDDARLALTSSSIQNGDVVKVESTGLMYYVKDDSKLGTEDAFSSFTAGIASSVPWSGITGKPSFATVATSGNYNDLSNRPTIYQPGTSTPKAASGSGSVGTATTFSREDHIHPVQTSVSGNAGTATKFASAQSIALTGDVSGSASSQAGWSIATVLANSGVTAGNYGTDENVSPGYGGNFNIPYFSVDAKGRITSASNIAITLPSAYTHPAYTAKTSGLYKITVDATGHVSATAAVAKSDITALGIPAQDTVYTHPSYTAKASGLYKVTVDATGHVSATAAVAKSDITALGIPAQDTTYNSMTAATSSEAGKEGLVPAPAAGKQTSFLRGDGTWAIPTDTVYTHPAYTAKTSGLYKITVDATGHVSATAAVAKSDITALGIPAQDTVYTHPAYTAKTSGLYKITVDATGHVSATAAVEKSDITALGIPAQDTVYTGDKGITLTGTTFGHSNSITAGTAQGSDTGTLTFGGTFTIPTITYDAYGHITGKNTTTMTMPAAPTTISGNAGSATKLANARTLTIGNTGKSFDGTDNVSWTLSEIGAQAAITGAATTIVSSNLTASRALISNSSGKVAVSDVTSTQLGYLSGATSNIQTQINSKASSEKGIYYIIGTGTTAGTWLGSHNDIAEYYEGLTIAYKTSIAGVSGGTTLNINNLGAVNVRLNATTNVTTHFSASTVLILVYTIESGVGYWKMSNYYNDSKTRQYYTTTNANYPILFKYASGITDTTSYTTNYARVANNLYFNPSTGMLTTKGLTVSTAGNVSGISVSYSATISTTWSGSGPYSQTITVTGIKAADKPIADFVCSGTYATDKAREEAWGQIYRIVPAANSITVYAHAKTTTSCPITLLVVR